MHLPYVALQSALSSCAAKTSLKTTKRLLCPHQPCHPLQYVLWSFAGTDQSNLLRIYGEVLFLANVGKMQFGQLVSTGSQRLSQLNMMKWLRKHKMVSLKAMMQSQQMVQLRHTMLSSLQQQSLVVGLCQSTQTMSNLRAFLVPLEKLHIPSLLGTQVHHLAKLYCLREPTMRISSTTEHVPHAFQQSLVKFCSVSCILVG